MMYCQSRCSKHLQQHSPAPCPQTFIPSLQPGFALISSVLLILQLWTLILESHPPRSPCQPAFSCPLLVYTTGKSSCFPIPIFCMWVQRPWRRQVLIAPSYSQVLNFSWTTFLLSVFKIYNQTIALKIVCRNVLPLENNTSS